MTITKQNLTTIVYQEIDNAVSLQDLGEGLQSNYSMHIILLTFVTFHF